MILKYNVNININIMETSNCQNILPVFKKLSIQYQNDSTKNQFQVNSIKKAVELIQEYESEHAFIESGKEALKIKGIGKGISSKIDEILATGTLKILNPDEDILVKELSLKQSNEFKSITGLGNTRIAKLNQLGIFNITQLRENAQKEEVIKLMTDHINIGIKYYEDFNEKIPRDEISQYKVIFDKVFDKLGFIYEICGSYRRMKDECGDMDILITHPSFVTESIIDKSVMKTIIKKLIKAKVLLEDGLITPNATIKFMGTTKLPIKNSKARRLDIRIIQYDSYPTALMYFTGAANFNVRMRNKAISMDMKLNEYGLFHKDIKLKITNENDIFEILKEDYLEPHERT
jgi:DNA polymerase beta